MTHTAEGSWAPGPALWRLLETTGSATGEAYFVAAAQALTQLLGWRYVLVAELVDPERWRSLAFLADGRPRPRVECDVRGTFVQGLLQTGSCVEARGAAQRFPEDPLFSELRVEGCLGVAIRCSEGAALGVLAAFDEMPIHDTAEALSLLRAASLRAAGEIERLRLEHARQQELRLAEASAANSAKIQQAQKLECLGVLAGGIAHDFNNLLVGILGNVGFALLELPPSSPLVSALEDVREAALRAAELTKQMLAYSGKGRFVTQRLNLNRLVEETAHLLGSVLSRKATLRLTLPKSLPDVEADGAQIRQIFVNLITNADDALNGRPGTISVRTGSIDADEEYLASTYLDEALPAGRYVFLEVSDTGAGMDCATSARIFDPFFSTKFTGRGLGLAAVLGILRGHRGAIKVESEPQRGSTFRVLLPIATVLTTEQHLQDASPARMEPQSLVLVADDESGVRKVAERILTREGYRVLLAENGTAALELYARHADEVSVVLLDMTMPELNGIEVYEELRRIRPNVRVVLSSGYDQNEATAQVVGQGGARFLHKPWLPSELLAVVKQALAAGLGTSAPR